MPANTKTIDNCIFWQEHVRDMTRDPAQRARCNEAILRLMQERRELVRYYEERNPTPRDYPRATVTANTKG